MGQTSIDTQLLPDPVNVPGAFVMPKGDPFFFSRSPVIRRAP